MRKMILIVAAIFVLTLPISVWADSPGAGFDFDHTASITMGGSYWSYSGGPFYSTLNGSIVPAYCVEMGVYFTPGLTYMVDLYTEVDSVDPPVSDWFWFASYDINTYGLDNTDRLDQIATQYAVWAWAGEFGATTDWSLVPVEFRERAEVIYNSGTVDMLWDDSGYRYADLYEAQDQIVPVPAVPEPMTMLLLGLGLIGVAGIRRKFKG